jgi:cytochrome c553
MIRNCLLLFAAAVLPLSAFADTRAGEDRLALQLVTVRCSLCHGLDGQSLSPLYPKLASQNAEYIVKQIFNFKTGQRDSTVMRDVANTLSAADIRALADYFSRLPITPHPPADPEVAAVGRYIYFRGNPLSGVSACVTCHGVYATGGAQMPRLAGQHAEYLERQLKSFIGATRSNDMSMHGVVRGLTELEIRGVSQYLSGQE